MPLAVQYAVVTALALAAGAYVLWTLLRPLLAKPGQEPTCGCGHCGACPVAAIEEAEGRPDCEHRDEWCPHRGGPPP